MKPSLFYKCLADETRLRCLLLISEAEELCVCELTSALAESQPKISRHLAQLREAGLLQDRRQSQWVFYRIHEKLPGWCTAVLRETLTHNEAWLSPQRKRLHGMGDRPQRQAKCC